MFAFMHLEFRSKFMKYDLLSEKTPYNVWICDQNSNNKTSLPKLNAEMIAVFFLE